MARERLGNPIQRRDPREAQSVGLAVALQMPDWDPCYGEVDPCTGDVNRLGELSPLDGK